jgi:hypothetical protein
MAKKNEIKMDRVKVDVMQAACRKLGIKTTAKSPKILAGKLKAYFAKSDKTQFQCQLSDGGGHFGCLGFSTDEVDDCPYCGISGIDPVPAPEIPEDATKDEVVTTLAEAAVEGAQLQTVDDLDKSVAEIKAKQDATVATMWELAGAIAYNFEHELWRLRRDENGAPIYGNVKEFWEAELGFGRAYCYGLMDVRRNFTEEDMKQIGPTKLRTVLRAPEGKERKKLLEQARKGASKADLEETVKKVKAKERKKNDKPAAEAKKTKTSGKKLTVARRPERSEHPLYAYEPDEHGEHGELRPATTLADQPGTTVRISDELVVSFRVVQDLDGSILLIEEWRRQLLGATLKETIDKRNAKKGKKGKQEPSTDPEPDPETDADGLDPETADPADPYGDDLGIESEIE